MKKQIGSEAYALQNGSPIANGDTLITPGHALHVCECALAMLKELEALNRSWLKRGLPAVFRDLPNS